MLTIGLLLQSESRSEKVLPVGKEFLDKDIVGYWKLCGDCKDYSGMENHGKNHGVNLAYSEFNGRDSYIEVPDSPALNFGTVTSGIWIFSDGF